jgi:hypothetical protein
MQRDFIDESKWTGEKDFFKRRELREAEIDRYYNTYPQVPHGGKRSYAHWLLERSQAGLPTNVDPPADVESCEDWRTRTIGVPTHPGSPTLGVSHTVSHSVSRTVTVTRDLGYWPRFSFLKFLYPRPEVADDPFAYRPVAAGAERLERLRAMQAMTESGTGGAKPPAPAPVVAGAERLARLAAMRDMQSEDRGPTRSLSHRAQWFLYNLVR